MPEPESNSSRPLAVAALPVVAVGALSGRDRISAVEHHLAYGSSLTQPRSACAEVMASTRCAAMTKAEKPCPRAPLHGGPYCFSHEPSLQHERDAASRLGGHNRRRRRVGVVGNVEVQLRTALDIQRLLEKCAADEMALEPGHQKHRTLAAIAIGAARVLELVELERRIAALEDGDRSWRKD